MNLKTAPQSPAPSVAIVDIGSNTLKILVATKSTAPAAGLRILANAAEDVRISPGKNDPPRRIPEAVFAPAADAINRLLARATPHRPAATQLVATSCVREAANAAAFCQFILSQTAHLIEILSGEDEALSIADGVATDPAFCAALAPANLSPNSGFPENAAPCPALAIADLGGGSLEYIQRAQNGKILAAQSFPLGAARLAREFLSNWASPNPPAELSALAAHVRQTLQNGKIAPSTAPSAAFSDAGNAPLSVGCGGAFSICRAILAAQNRQTQLLEIETIRELRDSTAALNLQERQKIPALPPTRADIFPTALTIILALAEQTRTRAFLHTHHSLRHGLAARLLNSLGGI